MEVQVYYRRDVMDVEESTYDYVSILEETLTLSSIDEPQREHMEVCTSSSPTLRPTSLLTSTASYPVSSKETQDMDVFVLNM